MAISTAQQKSRTREKPVKVSVAEYQLSGPYTHKNLSIFLVHGKNTFEGKTFITLQEAMVQKKVVVYETKSVNELAIENVSNDDIYVQPGDIVKGRTTGSHNWCRPNRTAGIGEDAHLGILCGARTLEWWRQ